MSGRFLTAPFFIAVILISRAPFNMLDRRTCRICFMLVILAGLASPVPTIFTGPGVGAKEVTKGFHRAYGIKDERASYYEVTGFLRSFGGGPWPDFPWTRDGDRLRAQGGGVEIAYAIGYLGFHAGPSVHIIDENALADPLLARIKIVGGPRNARRVFYLGTSDIVIGHFKRDIPAGYRETLLTGENKLDDPNLAAYYEILSFITRGPLFDLRRCKEIARMNLGHYDHYLEAYLNCGDPG